MLCLWFPNWPIQRLRVARPELRGRAIGLYQTSGTRGAELVACSRALTDLGARLDMPVAEANALAARRPDAAPTTFERHDPAADLALLRSLAHACRRYSPLAGIESGEHPESLLLEIGGSAHLFGGEQALAEQIQRDFQAQHLASQLAIAEGIGAAWALAHYAWTKQGLPHIVHGDRQQHILGQLPVDALRLPAKVLQSLHELEIRSIAQLQQLPRTSLPSRFGTLILERLDQALGRCDEVLIPENPPRPATARWGFEYPTHDRRVVETVLKRLLAQLVEQLAPRREGLLKLCCRIKDVEHDHASLHIGLVQPSISPSHLMELLKIQLEKIQLDRDVVEIVLTSEATGLLAARQETLFTLDNEQEDRRQLDALVDRLSNRLGRENVVRAHLSPDPQPEFAVRYAPLVDGKPQPTTADDPPPRAAARPLLLECQPQAIEVACDSTGAPLRFRTPTRIHHVAHTTGPERIETGWWRRQPIQRDYYHVETDTGKRFWLFQNEHEEWFLHGAK